jgi:hypothetical protein
MRWRLGWGASVPKRYVQVEPSDHLITRTLVDTGILEVFLESKYLLRNYFVGALTHFTFSISAQAGVRFIKAVNVSHDDNFLTVLGKVCELFDRPSAHELPKGMRLNTVKTYLPQVVSFSYLLTALHVILINRCCTRRVTSI